MMTSAAPMSSCMLLTKPSGSTRVPPGHAVAAKRESSLALRPHTTTTCAVPASEASSSATVSYSAPMPSPPPTSSTAGSSRAMPFLFCFFVCFLCAVGGGRVRVLVSVRAADTLSKHTNTNSTTHQLPAQLLLRRQALGELWADGQAVHDDLRARRWVVRACVACGFSSASHCPIFIVAALLLLPLPMLF